MDGDARGRGTSKSQQSTDERKADGRKSLTIQHSVENRIKPALLAARVPLAMALVMSAVLLVLAIADPSICASAAGNKTESSSGELKSGEADKCFNWTSVTRVGCEPTQPQPYKPEPFPQSVPH